MLDDRLYLFTTSGAPRGRLFSVDPARPDRAHWREVIKESAEVLQDVAYFRGGLAAASLQDAALRLRLYDAEGAPRGEIALPGLGALTGLTGARDVAEIGYGFTSFLTPTEVFRVDVTAPKAPAATTWRKLQAPIDAAAFEVERVMVTSRDGTKLPLFLAHRKGTKRDGAQPALLTGYGGFDHSMLPTWTPSAIPFLEAGGTYAVAVLRGGGEYGEDWHRAGMFGNKQNVFDDFIAAAEWLVANQRHQRGSTGDLGTLERRPAGGRRADAAAGPVPRGRLRRATPRHAPLSSLSHCRPLDRRIRLAR